MTGLATIVVPTLDRPHFLRLALASALAQTVDAHEIVVVDEGGLDKTREVVASFGDARIRLHRQVTRVGMVENWGTGVRLATTEYVAVLADDDRLGPTFLETRITALDNSPAAVAAFSAYEVRTTGGSLVRLQGYSVSERRELRCDALVAAALDRSWFIGASLYRRTPVVDVWPRLTHDDLVLDLGLNVRLALQRGAVAVVVPARDFVMIVHPGQNSESRQGAVRRQTDSALARIEHEAIPRWARRSIRRERALWLATWARSLAEHGENGSAIRLLLRAVPLSPTAAWPWRQLLLLLARRRRCAVAGSDRDGGGARGSRRDVGK